MTVKVYRRYRVEALITRREYYSTAMHSDSLSDVVKEVLSLYESKRVGKIMIQHDVDGITLGKLLNSDFRID